MENKDRNLISKIVFLLDRSESLLDGADALGVWEEDSAILSISLYEEESSFLDWQLYQGVGVVFEFDIDYDIQDQLFEFCCLFTDDACIKVLN